MKKLWFITYNILFLPFFWLVTRVISLFNAKVRASFRERKGLFAKLEQKLKSFDPDKKIIIIHCSSLGEFEQAKPIIEQLDRTNRYNFVLSFFSPSGYNHSKLDTVLSSKMIKTYIPFDSYDREEKFIDIIKPDAVIFIKYDIWFNFLYCLEKKNVLRILANAAYDRKFFKWRFFITRSYFKTVYNFFSVIASSNRYNLNQFKRILSPSVRIEMFGDTKFERVKKAMENAKTKSLIESSILLNKYVLVVGSSWTEDENVLFPVIDRLESPAHKNGISLLIILAPHEPNENHLEDIERNISFNFPNLKSIRYSNLNNYKNENFILVDCIGLLITLYKYADIAYVGGAWHLGLHNVLEPAGYGIPVLFGNGRISEDAGILVKKGGGISVQDERSLYSNLMMLLKEKDVRNEMGHKSYSLFDNKKQTSIMIAELVNTLTA
jgi:3-deoxy-D-manno-octulosonic-acid transferase